MSDDLIPADPLLPNPFVQGLVRAAALNGVSVDSILHAENIDLENAPGIRLSKAAKILNYFVGQLPITTIFPIMQVFNDEAINEILTISSTARTLSEATEHMMACGPFSPAGLQLSYDRSHPDYDNYQIHAQHTDSLSRLFVIEFCAATFVRFLPAQFQKSTVIERVEFEFDLTGELSEYEAFFACPVVFGHLQNRIRLKKGVIDAEILSHSPALLERSISLLQEKTDTLLSLQGYRFRVAQVIREMVADNIKALENRPAGNIPLDLSIESVAGKLGLNVRALQRKLKQEGGAFVDCKNQTLVDESKKWMDAGQSNLDLISDSLGFTDRTYFSKVFKKYEGIWPAQYKQKP